MCGRVHCLDPARPGRLMCGRREAVETVVCLPAAELTAGLCHKCRQRLAMGWQWLDLIHQPLAIGVQLEFDWGKECS
jgi:hypothetical protein